MKRLMTSVLFQRGISVIGGGWRISLKGGVIYFVVLGFNSILELYLQFATYFGAVELFSINTIYTGLTAVFVPFYHPKSH